MKSIFRLSVVAASLLLLCLAGCRSTKIILPVVNETPADISLPGKFIWYDLHTTDMTAASNFYENLFGWQIERTNDLYPQVKTIYQGRQPIGTMYGREAEPGDSEWISCLSVPEVNMVCELVEDIGGTIETNAADKPNRGRQAVILDPQGAKVALLTSSSGDPADMGLAFNRFMGSELWTDNTDTAVAFYGKLAKYEASPMDTQTSMPYILLSTHRRPRATVNALINSTPGPKWIPLCLVKDLQDTLKKVPELGGTVVQAPTSSLRQGRAAVIKDPSGALITVQQAYNGQTAKP